MRKRTWIMIPVLLATAGLGIATPASAAPAAVTLSADSVAKRTRITIEVAAFEPRTMVTVTETYRYATRGIFKSHTVALGTTRVTPDGTARRAVLPVQSARAGILTIRGTGADGEPTSVSQRIQVG